MGGIMFQIIAEIFYGTVNVLGPFDKPLHTELVHQIHKNGNIKGEMYVPSLLDDLCQSSEALEHLKQMDVVCFAGGALSLETSRLISAAAVLLTTMGSTETGFPPSLEVSQDDWNYFNFHPSSGIEFHQLTDELYEQVIPYNLAYSTPQCGPCEHFDLLWEGYYVKGGTICQFWCNAY
jgi:hypothetical protein